VLTPLIAELAGAAQSKQAAERIAQFVGRNWTAHRKRRAEAVWAKAAAQPIDCEWLMLTITDLLPKGAIVVDEGLTTAASLAAFLPIRDRYAYFGNVSAAALVGASPPQSASNSHSRIAGSWPCSVTAAPCTRSRRYGPPLITSCR
jgi:hypothetical protein